MSFFDQWTVAPAELPICSDLALHVVESTRPNFDISALGIQMFISNKVRAVARRITNLVLSGLSLSILFCALGHFNARW
jgi:hypothetical protein